MNSPVLLVLFIISLGLSSCSSQAPKAETTAPIDPTEALLISSIPGAPAPDSVEDVNDWKELVRLQVNRTENECVRAASEYEINLMNFFGPRYGPLKKSEVETLTSFFDDLRQQSFVYTAMVKKHWQRVRPYDAHADLNPCIGKEKSFSYPSGHTTIGRLYYHVLSEIFPKRTKKFLARSDQIALDRNIAGVHYPSDTRDGKVLGDKIYHLMSGTEAYQRAIAPFVTKR